VAVWDGAVEVGVWDGAVLEVGVWDDAVDLEVGDAVVLLVDVDVVQCLGGDGGDSEEGCLAGAAITAAACITDVAIADVDSFTVAATGRASLFPMVATVMEETSMRMTS